jgi:hypothetical protein
MEHMVDPIGARFGEVFAVPRAEDCGGAREWFAALREHERLEAVQLFRKAELAAAVFDRVARLQPSSATGLFPFSLRESAVQELGPALGVSAYKAGEFVDFAEAVTKHYPKLGVLLGNSPRQQLGTGEGENVSHG